MNERSRRRGIHTPSQSDPEPHRNGELPPPGRRGAAAALERLELPEERAHARLEAALARGEPVQIAACQDFW